MLALAPTAYALMGGLSGVPWDAENGPIELGQSGLWAAACLVAMSLAWRIRERPIRWFTAWLGVMAALGFARELDLHELANPETLGAWGVRYRIDWWLDAAAPIGPKLVWAVVFAVIGFLVVFPIARAWPKLFVALKRRWLVLAFGVVCAVGLTLGWGTDDLLRPLRQAQDGGGWYVYIEEWCELIGAWAFASAVGLLVWRR